MVTLVLSAGPAAAQAGKKAPIEDWSGPMSSEVSRDSALPLLAQAQSRVDLDIPVQPLSSALQQFAEQSGLRVHYPANLLEGLPARGISGAYTRENALRALLSGTGLSYVFTAPDRVVLQRPGAVVGESDSVTLPKVSVTESYSPFAIDGGSRAVISQEEIEASHPLSTIDVLQRTPGVHAIEEYGRGLRPNIGLRGLDPERSRNVLITADGMPIQPAMYGDPSAYYNVPIEQIERIEVIKGGASALYGPNTVGGVVNYVLRRPPSESELRLSETVRQGELFSSTLSYGTDLNGTGLLAVFNDKRGSTVRDQTDTRVDDASIRLVTPLASGGEADFRFGYYSERSETPGGLTAEQFKDDPNSSQRSFDVFYGRRFDASLNLLNPIFKGLSFDSKIYFNAFKRDWYIADSPDATATSNTQFLRDFVVAGVEPKLLWTPSDWADLVVGTRVHFEQLEDIQRQGVTPGARSGTTVSEAKLETIAIAPFASMNFTVIDGLVVTPGIRFERIEQSREVGLQGGSGGVDGSKVTEVVIGGLGLSYRLSDEVELFGNYSRNFKPPQFSQAIDPTTGTASDLSVETSNNFELGFRSQPLDWVSFNATGFWTIFKNQIIAEAGVLRNAGKTRHRGVEASLDFGQTRSGLSGYLSATYLDTEFLNGVNEGNELPQAPDWRLGWAVAYAKPLNFGVASVRLDGSYVEERFTDAANTVAESADGNQGRLPSYDVWNLRLELDTGEYSFGAWKLFAGVNNLFDREYRVRRQAFLNGIIPGLTRTFYAGVSAQF